MEALLGMVGNREVLSGLNLLCGWRGYVGKRGVVPDCRVRLLWLRAVNVVF